MRVDARRGNTRWRSDEQQADRGAALWRVRCSACPDPAPRSTTLTNLWVAIVADLIGITALAYGSYFRRYFRRDLLLA